MRALYPLDKLYLTLQDPIMKTSRYYHSAKRVTKLTKIGKPRSNATQVHYVLTTGNPNYAERAFIKKWVKLGRRFPILTSELYRA